MKCPACDARLRVVESRTKGEHLTGKLRLVAKKHGLIEDASGTTWCVRERKCDKCARVVFTVEETV